MNEGTVSSMRSQAKPDTYYVCYQDKTLRGRITRGAKTYQAALSLRGLLLAEGATTRVEVYRRANLRLVERGLWQFEVQLVAQGGRA